jgi:8-oxo-dGTP pyrophosphatase MutT (NUDIX family)
VLLPLFDVDRHPHVLLTRRADTLPLHRGQVSLPGGRWEEADGTLTMTALRETHEEVGIPPDAVQVVGLLDDVHTMVTGYVVTPVVGLLAERPVPEPNPEVGRVMEVPLGEILAIDAVLPADAGVAELRYPVAGEDVWGATARILRGFAAVVRAALR